MPIKSGMNPVHPGVVLREELDEIGLSANALAKAIDVPANRVTAILNAERGITADTALRLGRYFDTTAQFWLNLQQTWQIRLAEREAGSRILQSVVPRTAEAIAAAAQQAVVTSNQTASMVRAIARSVDLREQLNAFERAVSLSVSNAQMLRALAAPLSELRHVGVLETTLARELQHTTRWLVEYEKRFRLANVRDVAESAASLTGKWSVIPVERLAALKNPWFDVKNGLGSIERVLGLHELGKIASGRATFSDPAAVQVRALLGDWRDRITWPDNIWRDLATRADFYADLGFNSDLTDLPTPAFREVVEAADIRSRPPSLIESYGPPVRLQAASEEAAFARTNQAHDWLQRFESQLRRFIHTVMTRTFGPEWPRHRLPNGMYEKWKAKQETADRAAHRAYATVAYADFTDYVLIITRRDNWRELFESHFERRESVRESFQRLYPIRLDTMHARPISQDDELLLYVEVKRMMGIIKDAVDG